MRLEKTLRWIRSTEPGSRKSALRGLPYQLTTESSAGVRVPKEARGIGCERAVVCVATVMQV